MPEYYANPLSSGKSMQGLASLAEALVSGPQRRFEMDLAGRQHRADLERMAAQNAASYASAGASNALAQERAANTAATQLRTRATQQVMDIWDPSKNPQMPYEERIKLSQGIVQAAGLKPEDFLTFLPAFGAGMDDLDVYRRAAGDAYGTTKHAFDYEPVGAVGPEGNLTFSFQKDLVPGGYAPIPSETEARGLAFGTLAPEHQQAEVMGLNDPVRGPDGTVTTKYELLGQPNTALPASKTSLTEGIYGGTSIEAGNRNALLNINEIARTNPERLGPDVLRLYAQAYAEMSKGTPRWVTVENPDGSKSSVLVEGAPPDMSMYLTPQQMTARATNTRLPATPDTSEAALPHRDTPMPEFQARLNNQSVGGFSFLPAPSPSSGPPTTASRPVPSSGPMLAGPSAPSVPSPGPMPAQSSGVTTPTPAQAPPRVASGPVPVGSGIQISPPTTDDPPKITEQQLRLLTLAGDFGNSVRDLAELVDYDPDTDTFGPNKWFPNLRYDVTSAIEQGVPVLGGYIGRGLRGDTGNDYASIAFGVIEPLLRLRTGAAAPETEQVAYRLGLLPQSGQSDAINESRVRRLYRQLEVYQNVAAQMQLSVPELDAIVAADPNGETALQARALMNEMVARDEIARDETPLQDTSTSPGASSFSDGLPDTLTAPDGVILRRVK